MTVLPITYQIWGDGRIRIQKSMIRWRVDCSALMCLYDVGLEVYGVEMTKEVRTRLK